MIPVIMNLQLLPRQHLKIKYTAKHLLTKHTQ